MEGGDHSFWPAVVDWESLVVDSCVECFDLDDAGEMSRFSVGFVGVDCGSGRDMVDADSTSDIGFVCT